MTAYEMRISDWSADVCSSDLRLQPAQRLLQRFVDVAPDRHHLADRFHRGREQRLGAFELLEREARNLGDDVIDRRLERGRGDAGDVVLDLVERIAERQLRRDRSEEHTSELQSLMRRQYAVFC